MSMFVQSACIIWAALIGISVPLELTNTIFLNQTSENPAYHGFYVSNLAVIMGGLELIPLSFSSSAPWQKPRRWWHVAGGLCSLPAFGTIVAGAQLGTQLVIVTQLGALMGTFLAMDVIDGRVSLSDYAKGLGLLLVIGGIAMESFGGDVRLGSSAASIGMLALVAASGVGYALQSRCNGALADDLGSGARATMVSALVNICCGLPIDAWVFWGTGTSPTFDTRYWYLWLVAGFQSAFYIGSMAYLPKVLGFTTTYVITLSAKLLTSLAIDDLGLVGTAIPIDATRVVSVLCVLGGALMFNMSSKTVSLDQDGAENPEVDEEHEEPGRSMLISGTFVSVTSKSESFVGGSFIRSGITTSFTRSGVSFTSTNGRQLSAASARMVS
eukprot:TRINITY_DN108415_c0_g1_i1.p1 TRINITY_DN108415_c0_g1~~TRINITY_DN108415_c0_g1_i1.p1  ORF type:complete len:384 (+),score=64.30 TRINITY_DN108415_c0_g1_i1:64-1215(+)